ncbi:MAG: FliO/MopB family protein [Solirubrobacterales bacterium]|nr:FliO/MopB family protein [Solirubrobacterales bacterium]
MSRKLSLSTLVVGLVLSAPTSALAAAFTGPGENTPLNLPADAPRKAATVGGGSGNLVRTIVGLAVVIGVIYGVAWVLRQVKDSRESRVSGAGLQHAATIPLGPNRSLHLVRAGRELVLIGSAEHGVVPIRTYTEEEAIAVGLIDPADDADDDLAGPRPSVGPPRPATGLVGRLRELSTR